MAAKTKGGELYKASEVDQARSKYLQALEILRDLGDVATLTNDERGKAFEQNVLCYNNVALCCLLLKDYGEAVIFAGNALLLIKTLEARIPEAQIWQALLKAGFTQDKLLKGIKKKSHFYIGKAELYRKNYEEALGHFEQSLALIASDAAYAAEAKQLKEFISTASKLRGQEKKREKSTWSKAFSKSQKEYDSAPSSPAPSSNKHSMNDQPLSATTSKGSVTNFNGIKLDMSAVEGVNKDGNAGKKDEMLAKIGSRAVAASAGSGTDSSFGGLLFGVGLLGLIGGGLYWWSRLQTHQKR